MNNLALGKREGKEEREEKGKQKSRTLNERRESVVVWGWI